MWYLNIRGIKSKLESLKEKIEEFKPTIICITETHLLPTEPLEIEGYDTKYRNDRDNLGGGSLIAVSRTIENICTVVEKEKEFGETYWLAIDNTRIKLRLGLIYAPQECRTKVEVYKKLYKRIENQVEKAKERNQKLLMLGDFNCKIGESIRENRPEVSKSGKLLQKMVKKEKLSIVNALDVCGGKWTRVEGDSKSILDYMMIWEEDEKAVKYMKVDEERESAPVGYRDGKMTTSDHNVLTMEIDWCMLEKQKPKEERKILTKKGEKKCQEEIARKKVSMIMEKSGSFQDLYKEWKVEVTQIMEENKTTVKNQNPRKAIRNLIKKKKELKKEAKYCNKRKRKSMIDAIRQVDTEIEGERKYQFGNKINKVVDKLRTGKGINGPNMWEVLKKLKKKKEEPAAAIKDEKGHILEEPEAIKNRYLEYFEKLLQPVQAEDEDGKRQEEIIEATFQEIMEAADKQEITYTTVDEIEEAMKLLKRKKCKDGTGWNNEIILNGGEEMVISLHKIFNQIEEQRIVPKEWKEVIIKAINKPGTVLEMENKRGLFLTDVISKLYEKIMKIRNQKQVQQYISPNQTGGTKGKTTVDHVIVLNEIMRRNKRMGKKTYIVFGDAVKCFDKLWLKDSLVEMYKAGCNLQDIQIMYKLNNETEITVDTPFGKTNKVSVGEIVKQGTVLGPDLCCIATDQINNIGENQEKSVGEEIVGILVFVDDVMSAGTAEEIRKAIRNFAEMEKVKKFTYGLKKTKYMVMKTGREKEEIIAEGVREGMVSQTDEYRYVGLLLSKEGNLLLHLDDKKKKMKGQVVAMKSLACYFNLGPLFVSVRIELFDMCIIPSMLYNLEGWNELSKEELKKLESIQHSALCILLHLPKTTSYLGLLNELGMWKMEERLMYRKIMLYHNIMNSSEDRLVKRVVAEQEREGEEGTWFASVCKCLRQLKMDTDMVKTSSKSEVKKTVKKKIAERMTTIMTESKDKFTKMRFLNCEVFELKEYIKWGRGEDALDTLKTRLNMREIYGNYKGNYTLGRTCPYCQEEDDTTEHLICCSAFGPSNFTKEDLCNDKNIELWKQINERVAANMKWRDE